MEAQVDYYATLEVSPDADAAGLRRAYRALMRQYHPDVNKREDAAARCHALNEAYECLRDPARRASYDAMRRIADYHARQRPSQHSTSRPDGRATAPLHSFTPRYSMRFDEEPLVRTRWRRAAVIALGALVTLITFTVTSRVDLSSVAAAAPRDVVMKPAADPAN